MARGTGLIPKNAAVGIMNDELWIENWEVERGYLKIKITGKRRTDPIGNRLIFCKMGSISEFFF
jgi:hypothetical protein